MKPLIIAAALSLPFCASAFANTHRSGAADDALKSDEIAWDITAGLTTEIGPRMPGTEAEARARLWAIDKLTALGLTNIREESFMMPVWVRGEEKAEVLGPFAQPLVLTALGNSGSTGADGLTGEIAYFPNYAALEAAQDGSLAGKIVFLDHGQRRVQDGSHYRHFGKARFTGPNLAAKKGAAAFLVRSLGTDHHRNPHTGSTRFEEGVRRIPSAALTLPDADNLLRMVRLTDAGQNTSPIKVKMTLTPKNIGQQQSGNIIADIPGKNPDLPLILVACHLDSWDLGTGAIDDASGCGIVTAAAIHASKGKQPLRTIRILWAGAEEVGVWGGASYSRTNSTVPHAVAMESDFGADRVWRIEYRLHESAKPLERKISNAVARFGVAHSAITAGGGADIGPIIAAQKLGVIDLQQDGTRYFDLHHTPDDTLDKVDKAQLRQNVAVWTEVLLHLANYERRLKP